MADRSRRKSSILKPPKQRAPLQDVSTLNTRPEVDDDVTATTFTHTSALRRRVSFAGHNTVKEFYSGAESVSVWHAPAYQEPLTVSSDSSGVPADISNRSSKAFADNTASHAQAHMYAADDPYEAVMSVFGTVPRCAPGPAFPKRTRFSFGDLDSPDQSISCVKTSEKTGAKPSENTDDLINESVLDQNLEDDVFSDSCIAHSTAYPMAGGFEPPHCEASIAMGQVMQVEKSAGTDTIHRHAALDEMSSSASDMELTKPIPGQILQEPFIDRRQNDGRDLTAPFIMQFRINQEVFANTETDSENTHYSRQEVMSGAISDDGMEPDQALTANTECMNLVHPSEIQFTGALPMKSPEKKSEDLNITVMVPQDMEMTVAVPTSILVGASVESSTTVSSTAEVTGRISDSGEAGAAVESHLSMTGMTDAPVNIEEEGLVKGQPREEIIRLLSASDRGSQGRVVEMCSVVESEKTQIFDSPPVMEITVDAPVNIEECASAGGIKTLIPRERVARLVSYFNEASQGRVVETRNVVDSEKTQIFENPLDMELTVAAPDNIEDGIAVGERRTLTWSERLTRGVSDFDLGSRERLVESNVTQLLAQSMDFTEANVGISNIHENHLLCNEVGLAKCTPSIQNLAETESVNALMDHNKLTNKCISERTSYSDVSMDFTTPISGLILSNKPDISNRAPEMMHVAENEDGGLLLEEDDAVHCKSQTPCSASPDNQLHKTGSTKRGLLSKTVNHVGLGNLTTSSHCDVEPSPKRFCNDLYLHNDEGKTRVNHILTPPTPPHPSCSPPQKERQEEPNHSRLEDLIRPSSSSLQKERQEEPNHHRLEGLIIPSSRSPSPPGVMLEPFPALSPPQEGKTSNKERQADSSLEKDMSADNEVCTALRTQPVSGPPQEEVCEPCGVSTSSESRPEICSFPPKDMSKESITSGQCHTRNMEFGGSPSSGVRVEVVSPINTFQGKNLEICSEVPSDGSVTHSHSRPTSEPVPFKLHVEDFLSVSPHKSPKEVEDPSSVSVRNETSGKSKSPVQFFKVSILSKSPTQNHEVSKKSDIDEQNDPFAAKPLLLHSPTQTVTSTPVVLLSLSSTENEEMQMEHGSKNKQVNVDVVEPKELASVLPETGTQLLNSSVNCSVLPQHHSLENRGSPVNSHVMSKNISQSKQLQNPFEPQPQLLHSPAKSKEDRDQHPYPRGTLCPLTLPEGRRGDERIISDIHAEKPNGRDDFSEESLNVEDIMGSVDDSLQDSGSGLVLKTVQDVSRMVEAFDSHSDLENSGEKLNPEITEVNVESGNHDLFTIVKYPEDGQLEHDGSVLDRETTAESRVASCQAKRVKNDERESVTPSKPITVEEILSAEKKRLTYCYWEATHVSGMLWSFKFKRTKLELQLNVGSPTSPHNHIPATNGKFIWDVDESTHPIMWLGMQVLKRKFASNIWSAKLQFSSNLLELISDVTAEVAIGKRFMVELLKCQKREHLTVTREWVSFNVMSMDPHLWFRVKVDLLPWENILPSHVTMENILGDTRESTVQNLVAGVKKDVFFIARYVKQVNDYVKILKEMNKK